MSCWLQILLAAAVIAVTAPAYAEPVPRDEASRAQVQMLLRAQGASGAYAKEIGLDGKWVGYCWTNSTRKAEHSADGSIPFGVNYNNIERSTLNSTIDTLENWLTHDVILCLAQAKGDLARASEAAKR